MFLAEMTSEEAGKKLKEADIAILPIGSTEQHGPHLPLGTDTLIANAIAEKVSLKAAEKEIKVVTLPPLFFGFSDEHMNYPGTISLKSETLVNVIYDICKSLVNHGVKRILIICGHGGNISVVETVCRKIGTDFGVFVFYTFPFSRNVAEKILEEEQLGGIHADELETSVMLAIKPDTVKMNKAVKEIPIRFKKMKEYVKLGTRAKSDISFGWFRLNETLTKSGVIGDPTLASLEKGEKIIKGSVDTFVEFLAELKKLDSVKG
jgi:creatinine amidohydrolase